MKSAGGLPEPSPPTADFRVYAVIRQPARAKAWRLIMAQSGWPVEILDLDAFSRRTTANNLGLALLDLEVLNPSPQARVRECKAAAPAVPLLLTCAVPVGEDVLIELFDAGIDDYLPESLDPRLALAKLNSHLRRVLPRVAESLGVIFAPGGDIRLQRDGRRLSMMGARGRWDQAQALTPMEAKMLALFLKHPGMVLERSFLLEAAWPGEAEAVLPGTVDKHVESLRRKLGAKGSRILTVYGSGYLFKEKGS